MLLPLLSLLELDFSLSGACYGHDGQHIRDAFKRSKYRAFGIAEILRRP